MRGGGYPPVKRPACKSTVCKLRKENLQNEGGKDNKKKMRPHCTPFSGNYKTPA